MNERAADVKRAGQLLLEGLRQFNQASVMFSEHIEPAFERIVEELVSEFVRGHALKGELYWNKGRHWFASRDWFVNGERIAQFEDYMPKEGAEDYWLAIATGTGTRHVEWGYRFTPVRSCLGGTQSFNKWMKNQEGTLIAPITALALRYEGKGEFFIPVKFDAHQLGACWEEYGEFREEHELFIPLTEALEKILKALPHLSVLMNKAVADLSSGEP